MRRNIVLTTADSFRADHCSAINPDVNTTPTLRRISEDSLIFENAIAPGPRTPSSMPVIFTGEFVRPHNKGVYDSREKKKESWQGRRKRIRRHLDRFRTIAEQLRDRGYSTGAVTANPWTEPDTGFDAGFDHFTAVGEQQATDGVLSVLNTEFSTGILEKVWSHFPETSDWLLTWPDFYEEVHNTRDQLQEPYFLWVFLLDTHQPYFAPRRYRRKNSVIEMYYSNIRHNYRHTPFEELPSHLDTRLKRAYQDACRSIDGFVGQILEDLNQEDPILVFHSDHGEAFLEHGTRGHRYELYEENIRVPLVVYNSGVSGQIDRPISLRGLPDVLLSITCGENPADAIDGTDTTTISKTEDEERIAVRTPNWKYIRSREDWNYVRDVEYEELYHLDEDPRERLNLLTQESEVVKGFSALVRDHKQTMKEYNQIASSTKELSRL